MGLCKGHVVTVSVLHISNEWLLNSQKALFWDPGFQRYTISGNKICDKKILYANQWILDNSSSISPLKTNEFKIEKVDELAKIHLMSR